MRKTLQETHHLQSIQKFPLPEISPATSEEIMTYLRYSCKLAEIVVLSERDALVLGVCEQLGITVSDEELQAAGDKFRHKHKLLEASKTLEWLSKQRINIEDWSKGIRISLLTEKLKEYLFGAAIDAHYMANRGDYQRVALSQILVLDLTEALQITHTLRQKNTSFCALALKHSKGKQSQDNGGFVGVRFLAELPLEIRQAIAQAEEGEVLEPIQTKLGYHILKVEEWFPSELSEVREHILESLFYAWLQA